VDNWQERMEDKRKALIDGKVVSRQVINVISILIDKKAHLIYVLCQQLRRKHAIPI
jgi:hypothetical protein